MTGKQLRKVIFVGLVLVGLLFALCLPSLSQTAPRQSTQTVSSSVSSQNALDLALAGQQQYRHQQFSLAAQSWQQAADMYAKLGDREEAQKSLINQSQALQDLGLYPKACRTLLQAFNGSTLDCNSDSILSVVKELSAPDSPLSLSQSIGLRSFGDVLRRQGLLLESKQILDLSLTGATGSPEASATLLSLGNTERALGKQIRNRWDYEKVTDIINRQSSDLAIQSDQAALTAYQQAADKDSDSISQLQAQLNQLSLWLDLRDWWNDQTHQRMDSWKRLEQVRFLQRAENFSAQFQTAMTEQTNPLLEQIESGLSQSSSSRAKVFAQLNFALSLMRIEGADVYSSSLPSFDGRSQDINLRIDAVLKSALNQAQRLEDPSAEAYALGYMGRFYGEQGQFDQATQLTKKALMLSQQTINGDSREVSYLWQSQLGRFLGEQGDQQGALVAYTNAYQSLQSLRSDLNTSNQDVQFDFQQEVKPVYLALADLLLQPGQGGGDLEPMPKAPADLFPSSSTVAPTLNRLEMARQVIESLQLAELDNFFQDPCSEVPAIPVTIDDLDPQAAVIYPIVFRDRLDLILSIPGRPLSQVSVPVNKSEVDQTLDQLYDLLNNESIDTSAINIFRTVPISSQEVENNLQQLLPIFSQIYNWLVQPIEAQLDDSHVKTLVFVLNDRLQRIPMAALYDGHKYLVEDYGVALAPSLQLINPSLLKQKQPKVLAAGVSQQTKIGGAIFPALVNVPNELKQIQTVFPNSKQLLDADFTEQSLERSLTRGYSIVHLATHGLFSSNPDNNFIVTGDNQSISIGDLSALFRGKRTNAPQLLVLSACDTATGDERAVLGLAGVAVRSGASSTLATLWPVSDASTTTFMNQFYTTLSQPDTAKTDAMKGAQQSLIDDLKRNPPFPELKVLPPHPYYWAPYVLVGSWL